MLSLSSLQTETKKWKKRRWHLLFFKQKKRKKYNGKKNHREEKKCRERRELTFLFLFLHLEWSTRLAFSFLGSFNVELSSFLKPCVSHLFEGLGYSSSGALSNSRDGVSRNEVREVGRREVWRENFGAEKGAEKSLGWGRVCVFGSSPKQLEWPHLELVHWWLLVHSTHGQSWQDLTFDHFTSFLI